MSLFTWLCKRTTGRPHARRVAAPRPTPRFRPQLEALEGRIVPSFSSPVAYSINGFGAAVVTADVNGDGKPDLLTLASTSVIVQESNGNGTFGTLFSVGDGGHTANAFAVGDVNGDGKLDIVFANKNMSGDFWGIDDSVTVRLGSGQGRFAAPVVSYPFPTNVSSLVLADVYGDGKMDIVAAAPGGNVYVARPGGGGTFGAAQAYRVPTGLYGYLYPPEVAVGDFNGDGKPDIVVSNAAWSSVSVLLNNGNGTFGTAQNYAVGGRPTAVAVGDVSGDGKLDIVTANSNGTVSVLLNTGAGAFGAAQTYAISGPANSVALGDFNHDGHLDIATTGGTEMDVLLNNGGGTFGAYQKVGPAGKSVVVADFNGDGYPDLAEVVWSTYSIDVLMNKADW
jgi:FG-GAP-like repeat